MKRIFFALTISLLLNSNGFPAQSTITEAEDYSCMGSDKSRKQTEEEALTNAKRKALEFASTYIKSETLVKNFQLEKDLIEAYSKATVKLIQELDKSWYKDASQGECVTIKIRAEVIPQEQALDKLTEGKNTLDDPTAPLKVNIWTDKKEYKESEKIRIYVRANKPFYARVLYKSVNGNLLQLLPNPYREDHHFDGGAVYEIPSGKDHFEMEVAPPFGRENIIVYASTSPLGEIELTNAGGVYRVKTPSNQTGVYSRGVLLKTKDSDGKSGVAEFAETETIVATAPKN